MSKKLISLLVKAVPENGFYRAGRFWSQQGETVEVEPEVAERLKAEPRLVVVEVDKKDKPADAGKPDDADKPAEGAQNEGGQKSETEAERKAREALEKKRAAEGK